MEQKDKFPNQDKYACRDEYNCCVLLDSLPMETVLSIMRYALRAAFEQNKGFSKREDFWSFVKYRVGTELSSEIEKFLMKQKGGLLCFQDKWSQRHD